MSNKMTARAKAYRLVERELRKLDVREITLWGASFARGGSGELVNATVKRRGGNVEVDGNGLMAAVDAERRRQRQA